MPWEIPEIKNYGSVALFEGTFRSAHILLLKDIVGLNAMYHMRKLMVRYPFPQTT